MKLLPTLAIVAALPVAACARPDITSLDITSGPPHTLVMVQGTDLLGASVIWDAGSSTERPIPGGFLGASMFSVPPDATPGVHNLVARNSHGDSTTLPFTVQAPAVVFPKPRIDAVTLVGTDFESGGHLAVSLYVQGANIDVGAVVLLVTPPTGQTNGIFSGVPQITSSNTTELATVAHKGLRNNVFDVSPTEFGYPIAHFVSTVALSGTRTPGEKIYLAVRNLDMQTSSVVSYTLPADAASTDSDGDGLADSWETNGYNGVNLPMLGTEVYRRDILVELDVMPAGTATQPGLQHPPGAATFAAVQAMFSAAPILNPLGPPGINLILDTSGSVPYAEKVCFDVSDLSDCSDSVKYSDLKMQHFDNMHRDKIFHYAIWGVNQDWPVSGRSDTADDFLITFDDWATPMHTVRSQAEALTHELGHDLGLKHGGGDDSDHIYKPNYWSVMSYTWELRTGRNNQFRLDHATCPPFYYGKSGVDEAADGSLPEDAGTAIDYSSGMGRKLSPPTTGTTTICGKTVNWLQETDVLVDHADWPMLRYDGPSRNGWIP